MSNNIAEYLIELQQLTNKNLEILRGINESFLTKNNHISIQVDDNQYIIPSFLSLENKIDNLQENFSNLVNSPQTGESYFNVDGNTQRVITQGFVNTPAMTTFASRFNSTQFGVEQNSIFKDFLTPKPYLQFDLSDLSDDIVDVNVRKIVPRTDELKSIFATLISGTTSTVIPEADMRKIVEEYKNGTDYVLYDTIMKLPIRKSLGSATYVIEDIISDIVDENTLDEYITVKLRSNLTDPTLTNNLTYKRFDDLIEVNLEVGDILTTYNSSSKFEIMELSSSSNTIKMKVLNASYTNLSGTTTDDMGNIADICKLKFFSSIKFNDYKYVRVPLEEDQYVFIAIAPLNSRLGTQPSWGEGVLVDTFTLTIEDGTSTFAEYYKNNVKNIGDILFEVTSMLSHTLSTLTNEEIHEYENMVPTMDAKDLIVTQINKHLNNSTTVQNIRTLYAQKKQMQTALNEVQMKITEINNSISNINFNDTTNLRVTLTNQLTEYTNRKNDLVNNLVKITNQISIEANNATIPIENAKYHIRGYVNIESQLLKEGVILDPSLIKGVRIQYRYKNLDKVQGTAETINSDFIFSDWNNQINPLRPAIAVFDSETNSYKYKLQEYDGSVNVPSFNQIDIPISQGETVDIRIKIIYDFGYPFIEFTSQWSDILNIEFPEELEKDVKILDILEENNDDIETNRFQNIINGQGITSHVDDKVTDQDITYYHRPSSISSGFYTSERRIIPLSDKLMEMNAAITELTDEVRGTSVENIICTLQNGDTVYEMTSNQDNQVTLAAYNTITSSEYGIYSSDIIDGLYIINDKKKVSTVLNIVLTNPTQHTINLWSLFPGSNSTVLSKGLRSHKFDVEDYVQGSASQIEDEGEGAVWMIYKGETGDSIKAQTMNQFITFRMIDTYQPIDIGSRLGEFYKQFSTNNDYSTNKLSSSRSYVRLPDNVNGMVVYPYINSENSLTVDFNSVNNRCLQLHPAETIVIPLAVEYYFSNDTDLVQLNKTMSFDLRTSLYQDPINYRFTVTINKDETTQSSLSQANKKSTSEIKYNTTVIK